MGEDAGDSLDSDGVATRSYDDDCDGTVACYRNYDGDNFGTYEIDPTVGAANNDLLSTIALDG